MLDIWTPFRIKNNFAVSINSHEILLLGGKNKWSLKDTKSSTETINKVYLFNIKNKSFRSLPKLPFSHKISGVFYNGFGKVLWYVATTKSVFLYNLNIVYPSYDRIVFESIIEKHEKLNASKSVSNFDENSNWAYWRGIKINKWETKAVIELQDLANSNMLSVNRETKHSAVVCKKKGPCAKKSDTICKKNDPWKFFLKKY